MTADGLRATGASAEKGLSVKVVARGESSGSRRLSTFNEGAFRSVCRISGGFCMPGKTPVATWTTGGGVAYLRNGTEKFWVRRRVLSM